MFIDSTKHRPWRVIASLCSAITRVRIYEWASCDTDLLPLPGGGDFIVNSDY